jgi:hypothetical protein
MTDPEASKKNCLQWGLRVLQPQVYFETLRQYTVQLHPSVHNFIVDAHYSKKRSHWWLQSLYCKIRKEKIWMNIVTGRRVCGRYNGKKIGIFKSWNQYEAFREKVRELVEHYFETHHFHSTRTVD